MQWVCVWHNPPVQLGVCQPHEVGVQLIVQRAHLIGAHAAAFAKPTVYKHACRGWMVCVCHQISVSTRKTEENPEVHVHCNAPIFSACVTMLLPTLLPTLLQTQLHANVQMPAMLSLMKTTGRRLQSINQAQD